MSNIVETSDLFIFWKGWPSQWSACHFEVDRVTYNCCEQYMMAEKARVFSDPDCLALILASDSPREQKALGRKVRAFDEHVWNTVSRGIVYSGNLARFSQDDAKRERLLATGDKTIVEASPFDQIWGIGWSPEDPQSRHRAEWRGKNWLGDALTQVRNTLRAEADGRTPKLEAWVDRQLEARRRLGKAEAKTP